MPTYRDSDGDTYDEAEMESYYFEDTANLSDEDRAEITFEDWLAEVISWGRFSIVEDDES